MTDREAAFPSGCLQGRGLSIGQLPGGSDKKTGPPFYKRGQKGKWLLRAANVPLALVGPESWSNLLPQTGRVE